MKLDALEVADPNNGSLHVGASDERIYIASAFDDGSGGVRSKIRVVGIGAGDGKGKLKQGGSVVLAGKLDSRWQWMSCRVCCAS